MGLITSVGVVLTDKSRLLLCHATGKNYWDLPKGQYDDADENFFVTALRELKEETGIDFIRVEHLMPLGLFDYIEGKKNLYLFAVDMSKYVHLLRNHTFVCTSFYEVNGERYPEVDHFKFWPFKALDKICTKNMLRILQIVEDLVKEKIR